MKASDGVEDEAMASHTNSTILVPSNDLFWVGVCIWRLEFELSSLIEVWCPSMTLRLLRDLDHLRTTFGIYLVWYCWIFSSIVEGVVFSAVAFFSQHWVFWRQSRFVSHRVFTWYYIVKIKRLVLHTFSLLPIHFLVAARTDTVFCGALSSSVYLLV